MEKLHIWHRYIGITISAFVIILSITGLLLNLTDALKLTDSHISSNWLLKHYNIGDFPVTSFQINDRVISQASEYVYLDGEYILHLNSTLLGAIKINRTLVLATQSSLVIIDTDGQILDEVSKHTGLPENPLGISITIDDDPVIRGVNTYWKGTKELSAWQPLKGPHPKWVAPIETSSSLNNSIQTHARSNEINYERVLLDLHSGRLLGPWGQNIMSIAAILLLILAMTGIFIWLRKKPA